jgi:hypothetical protein
MNSSAAASSTRTLLYPGQWAGVRRWGKRHGGKGPELTRRRRLGCGGKRIRYQLIQ